jgi:hypothetical protein
MTKRAALDDRLAERRGGGEEHARLLIARAQPDARARSGHRQPRSGDARGADLDGAGVDVGEGGVPARHRDLDEAIVVEPQRHEERRRRPRRRRPAQPVELPGDHPRQISDRR